MFSIKHDDKGQLMLLPVEALTSPLDSVFAILRNDACALASFLEAIKSIVYEWNYVLSPEDALDAIQNEINKIYETWCNTS